MKENDQHLVQLFPNKLVTPFITVLLVYINVFGSTRISSAHHFVLYSFFSLVHSKKDMPGTIQMGGMK